MKYHLCLIGMLIFNGVLLHAVPVSEPQLRKTLPASWDENWFGSPAVYDLDGDGSMEIIAGRHSVLYVWDAEGTFLWRAPVGEDATSPNDHGKSRQYAAPVIGDLNWEYVFDATGDPFIGASGPVIGDLNKDNICEIVFTTYSIEQDRSHLVILDASGDQLHKVAVAKRGSMSPPTLADIDGDSKVEIILSLKDVGLFSGIYIGTIIVDGTHHIQKRILVK